MGAHGSLCDAVVVGDDAGGSNVGHHALCWVHAERLGGDDLPLPVEEQLPQGAAINL